MMRKTLLAPLCGLVLFGACSGGGGGGGDAGAFRLVEFLESGQNNIPRNRVLVFVFSGAVAAEQDLAERIQIENVQPGANSNFSRAIGTYVVTADRVSFAPRLPQIPDRSDAGLRANGNYTVFMKGGPDALEAVSGNSIVNPIELNFDTGDFFEDPNPAQPPRALTLVARDAVNGTEVVLDRIDPRPDALEDADSATLIASGRFIDPGAGGAPNFGTPWQFDLEISEPVDPSSVRTDTIELTEIFADATTSGEDAAPGAPADHFGSPVDFRVPIRVSVVQGADETTGEIRVFLRVTPLVTLVDNTRYRLRFSGNILGVDFRKTFVGDNGLTGDGTTVLAGSAGLPFGEPGGLGYTTEFIVRNRPSITSTRTLTYDPLVDGVEPEDGTTTLGGAINNTLYNPVSDPGRAVGFLPAFGDGSDGELSVTGSGITTIDTGDTPNAAIGNPFTVVDLNPNNIQEGPTGPGTITYDSLEPFEMQLASLVVSSAATLRVTGLNPILMRVSGLVQINGAIDVSGANGLNGGGGISLGGAPGAGGFAGGDSRQPAGFNCSFSSTSTEVNFQAYLNICAGARNNFPFSDSGSGPGRGHAGGEAYVYPSQAGTNGSHGASGGGGASHARSGTAGEDRLNLGEDVGTPGNGSDGFNKVRLSGIIGVRGQPGALYGDAAIRDIVMGGSGGGAGGAVHEYGTFGNALTGGAGGGGGGIVSIVSAGNISVPGGTIDASGGNGGNGAFNNWSNQATNRVVSGAGGGGSGGSIVLISGGDLQLAGSTLTTAGGSGGARSAVGAGVSCANCNAGGDGGKGFVFLMDADGNVDGVLPGTPGTVETATSVLTVSEFDATRFDGIRAVTRLFNVLVSDPDYVDIASSDILAAVNPGQRIRLRASSAKADVEVPLNPDLDTEIGSFEFALVRFDAGSTVIDITGDLDNLNPTGQTPARDAFARIEAEFEYDNGPESALGPFATVDEVTLTFTFN